MKMFSHQPAVRQSSEASTHKKRSSASSTVWSGPPQVTAINNCDDFRNESINTHFLDSPKLMKVSASRLGAYAQEPQRISNQQLDSRGEDFLLELLQKNQTSSQNQVKQSTRRSMPTQQSASTLEYKPSETQDLLIERLRNQLHEAYKIIGDQREEINVLKERISQLKSEQLVQKSEIKQRQHSEPANEKQEIVESVVVEDANTAVKVVSTKPDVIQTGIPATGVSNLKFTRQISNENHVNLPEGTTPILSLMCSDLFQPKDFHGVGGADNEMASFMNLSPIKNKSLKMDRSILCDRSCLQDIMKIPDIHHDTKQNSNYGGTDEMVTTNKNHKREQRSSEGLTSQTQNRQTQQYLQSPPASAQPIVQVSGNTTSGQNQSPNGKRMQTHLSKSNSDSSKVRGGKILSDAVDVKQSRQMEISSNARTRSSTNTKPRIIMLDDGIDIDSASLTRSQTTKSSYHNQYNNCQSTTSNQSKNNNHGSNANKFAFDFFNDQSISPAAAQNHQQLRQQKIQQQTNEETNNSSQPKIRKANSPSTSSLYSDFLRKSAGDNIPHSYQVECEQHQQQTQQHLPRQSAKKSRESSKQNQQHQQQYFESNQIVLQSQHQRQQQPVDEIQYSSSKGSDFGYQQNGLLFHSTSRGLSDQQMQSQTSQSQQGNYNSGSAQRMKTTPLKGRAQAVVAINQINEDLTSKSSLNLVSLKQSNSYHLQTKKYIEQVKYPESNQHQLIHGEFQAFPLSTQHLNSKNATSNSRQLFSSKQRLEVQQNQQPSISYSQSGQTIPMHAPASTSTTNAARQGIGASGSSGSRKSMLIDEHLRGSAIGNCQQQLPPLVQQLQQQSQQQFQVLKRAQMSDHQWKSNGKSSIEFEDNIPMNSNYKQSGVSSNINHSHHTHMSQLHNIENMRYMDNFCSRQSYTSQQQLGTAGNPMYGNFLAPSEKASYESNSSNYNTNGSNVKGENHRVSTGNRQQQSGDLKNARNSSHNQFEKATRRSNRNDDNSSNETQHYGTTISEYQSHTLNTEGSSHQEQHQPTSYLVDRHILRDSTNTRNSSNLRNSNDSHSSFQHQQPFERQSSSSSSKNQPLKRSLADQVNSMNSNHISSNSHYKKYMMISK